MDRTRKRKWLDGIVLACCMAVATVAAPVVLPAAAASAEPARTVQDVCGPVAAGFARCLSKIVIATNTSAPSGLSPADLQSAYSLPSLSAGAGQTVGIVDAYDSPTAEADLAVYRAQFGLPACTTANGCFRKVDSSGGTAYPKADTFWGEEISRDLDAVSAICPN